MIFGCDRRFLALIGDLDEAFRLRRTDAFDAAARQHVLAVHIEQTILEAGAAKIGDEDFHG